MRFPPVSVPADPAPFRIEPAVAGEWLWEDPRTLVFRPEAPLPRGRRFTLVPRADFAALTEHRLEDPTPRVVETGALRLSHVILDTLDREEAILRFEFDQAVSPRVFEKSLVVSREGTPLAARVITDSAALVLHVAVPRSEGASVITVHLSAGLRAAAGELPLAEDVKSVVPIPGGFSFIGAHASRWSGWNDPMIHLNFSAPLASEVEVGDFIIEPPVEGVRITSRRGNRVRLRGEFPSGSIVSITIPDTLLSSTGEKIDRERVVQVSIPPRPPSLDFPLTRGVLAPEGNRALRLRATNVGRIDFDVWRVHENNLVSHLLRNGDDETARALGRKSVVLSARPNEIEEVALDLAALLGDDARGIFSIRARGEAEHWVGDRAVVSISDLGIRARVADRSAVVWVNSIRHGTPVAGAEVIARTRNDQVIATAITAADGLATVALPRARPDGDPFVIVVRTGEDRGFLRLNASEDAVRGVDLSGAPWPESYEVFLTTERGVARPGETVHLCGILRDATGAIPPPLPLEIAFIRPDGRVLTRETITPTEDLDGFFEHAVTTASDAMTGLYEVTVTLPGGGAVLGRADLRVEHFLPVRLEVTARAVAERSGPVHAPAIEGNARTLHGGSIEGSRARVVTRYSPRRTVSVNHPDFSFRRGESRSGASVEAGPFPLEASGAWSGELDVPSAITEQGGEWDVTTAFSVTEPGSRTVSATARGRFDASGRHVGVRVPANGNEPGVPITLEAVLIDDADDAIAGRARWALSRRHIEWHLREANGAIAWQREESFEELERGVLVFAAEAPIASAEVVLPEYGMYRWSVTDDETGASAIADLSGWGSNGTPPERERGEQIALALPAEEVSPGETIDVSIDAPFGGRLLVTLETDRIVSARVIESIAKDGSFSVKIPATARGSLFLAATIVRPVDPSARDWRPHRATGIVRVPLPKAPHRLPVEILAVGNDGEPSALEATAPLATETIIVRTGPPNPAEDLSIESPAVVQLWGVDRGVILATDFATPDPGTVFLAARRAVVRGLDLFGDLLPDDTPATELAFIGGDGDRERRRRSSPVDLGRRPSHVVWCAAQSVADDGTARFEVEIPDLLGELTWFAIVAKGDRYGSARSVQRVTAPVLVENPWPRFVAPGDRFSVPMVITNTTEEDLAILPTLTIDGPLEVEFETPPEGLRLPANGALTIEVEARAINPGPVTIVTRALAVGDDDGVLDRTVTSSMVVRPVTAFAREARIERATAGRVIELAGVDDFVTGTASTELLLCAAPQVELVPAIAALVDYPYGCVEQTSSRLFALAVAFDPRVGFVDSPERETLLRHMARRGVLRLERMQNRDGGIGYWAGGRSSAWGTGYALEALTAIAATGIEVPASLCDDLRTHLRDALPALDDIRSANTLTRTLRLLAADPDPPRARILRWSERAEHLDLAGRVDLARAWLTLGEPTRAHDLVRGDLDAWSEESVREESVREESVREGVAREEFARESGGGRITSALSQRAQLLELLTILDPDDPRVPLLVASLSEARTAGRWLTTFENAAAIRALAAAMAGEQNREPNAFEGELRVGDRTIPFDEETPLTETIEGTPAVQISSTGTGSFSVVLRREGMRETPPEPFERGLSIERHWRTPTGETIEPGTPLAAGDLVIVTVEARTTGGRGTARYAAIVDALPGGLEPENPTLVTSASPVASEGSASPVSPEGSARPDRIEFLDDRVLIFDDIGPTKQSYTYALRATTPGTFAVPPLEASSMVDPAFGAITAAGAVTVEAR